MQPEYMTKTELAEALEIAPPSIEALIATEVIKGATTIGRTRAIPTSEKSRLALPWVTDNHGPLLVVKVRAATPSGDSRPWKGWKPRIEADDPRQMDGVRMYWSVKDPDLYVGERLAPTTAGYIHAIYRIIGYQTFPGRLRAFDIIIDDSDEAKSLMQQRFRPTPGGLIELR